MAGKIVSVEKDSLADRAGVMAGDLLIAIDQVKPADILDYQVLTDKPSFNLLLDRAGHQFLASIKKAKFESLGLTFESSVFDELMSCENRCLFCFIDQLPKGVRKSLLLKDDDFRHSFLYGNFITLTNLKQSDISRIIEQRLSPLYVSIHSLNPSVRTSLIRPKKGDPALSFLRELAKALVELHVQIVLCPGINDGEELDATLKGLIDDFPSVASIGIVPVGLTGHRSSLYPLTAVTKEQAAALIDKVSNLQTENLKRFKARKVFLSDEFYLLAQKELPRAEEYEEFYQLENGIGLARLFLNSAMEEINKTSACLKGFEASALTGELGQKVLLQISEALEGVGAKLKVIAVKNHFFSGHVSVTGLLTGYDIIKTLDKIESKGPFLFPDIVLNDDGKFLDDLTVSEVAKMTGKRVIIVPSTGDGFIEEITRMNKGETRWR